MDESLSSQDFLGLSQWQELGKDIILVNAVLSFWFKMGEGLLDVTRCCEVFLWYQALYSPVTGEFPAQMASNAE